MFDKLDGILERYDEIMEQLNDPNVVSDQNNFRKLMKEQSDLAPDVYKRQKYELRNEVGTVSDYYRASNGDYVVHCQVKEGDSTLIEVNVATPDKETASKMCATWEDKDCSQEIYQYVIDKLTN